MLKDFYDVCMIGLGPVGAVSGLCFARQGFRVVGVDIDQERVQALAQGRAPFTEPGIDALTREMLAAGRFTATADFAHAVQHSRIIMIAVGTPTPPSGEPDLSFLDNVAESLGKAFKQKITGTPVVVVRSTVPPGTMRQRLAPRIEKLSRRRAGRDFHIASNPEFLREGKAIQDFFDTGRVVIGTDGVEAAEWIEALYRDVSGERIRTTVETAEFSKYADNSWHALKVAFANEIGRTVRAFGGNVEDTARIFLADEKLNISARYLQPGFAFGGSCLPKDVCGLHWFAARHGVKLPVIGAIMASNQEQIAQGVAAILATGAQKVGLLGVAFKKEVDDLRESPALYVAAALKAHGVQVAAHDAYYQAGDRLILPDTDETLEMAELETLTRQSDLLVKFHDIASYNALQAIGEPPLLDFTQVVQQAAQQKPAQAA